MSTLESKPVDNLDEDLKTFVFDASFLDPTLYTNDQQDPVINILSIDQIHGSDTGFLMDIINWMLSRHLFNKEIEYRGDTGLVHITLELDAFQISTSFNDNSEEHITGLIHNAIQILHTLKWSVVEYEIEKTSDDLSLTKQELEELEEDVVETIILDLYYQIPVTYPLND